MTVDEDVVRLRFDGFELDEADARLTRAGQPVPLPPKPFAVLCTLARSRGRLVTKNALLDSVWGHRFVTESVLKSAISEVRAVLGDDSKQPRYIETVSRRGYRFIAGPATDQPQDRSVLERIMSLCRSDAALAELISSVATALERERLVLNEFRQGPSMSAEPLPVAGGTP
jgi:DNA-binding winged helix-turn-helix (wHTH) protein